MPCYLLAGSRLVFVDFAGLLRCVFDLWVVVVNDLLGVCVIVWFGVVEFGYLFVMGFVVAGGCLLGVWCGDCLLV